MQEKESRRTRGTMETAGMSSAASSTRLAQAESGGATSPEIGMVGEKEGKERGESMTGGPASGVFWSRKNIKLSKNISIHRKERK